MSETIVNRVEQSGIVQLNLEDLYPKGERIFYDLASNLFQGLVLKEKEYRVFLREHDWSVYKGKHVAIGCSVAAIIPTWAYMLLASKLVGVADTIVVGSLEELELRLFNQALDTLKAEDFTDKKVVVKGCSDKAVPLDAYVRLTNLLTPVVQSLMFGEPCSTVPIYKKPVSR